MAKHSTNNKVSERYGVGWNMVKNLDTIYMYQGGMIYLAYMVMSSEQPRITFNFLNTNFGKTNNEAFITGVSEIPKLLKNGTITKYDPDAKLIPKRMKVRKFMRLSDDGLSNYLLVTHNAMYVVSGGTYRGHHNTKCLVWHSNNVFLNKSSYGMALSMRVERENNNGSTWNEQCQVASGFKDIREINEAEATELLL